MRERVFEPAFADLVRRHRESGTTAASAFGLNVLGTYAACLPVAAPHPFVRRGKLTRLGKACLASAFALVAVVLVLVRLSDGYGPPTGP